MELIALLIGPSARPRRSVRNKKMWRAAAAYVAANPDATISGIKKAIDYDQHTQIRAWLNDPEFAHEVEQERLILKARLQKNSRRGIDTPQ